MFNELQQAKSKLSSLKQETLSQPMPTQHSLHASKVASASLPKLTLSNPMQGASLELPTEQGYKDIPLPSSSESLILARRPGDNQGVEYQRKLMNEQ